MVFSTLLSLPPIVAIAIVGFAVSLLVTLITKYTTNQKVLKQIRQDVRELQKKMKTVRHDAAQASHINKQLMRKTSEQMRHSMRSFFFTMLPVLLIFTWMQGNVAFQSIEPGQEFTTTVYLSGGQHVTLDAQGMELLSNATQQPYDGMARWQLRAGEQGTGTITYHVGEETYARDVLITQSWRYLDPDLEKKKSILGFDYGDDNPILPNSAVSKIQVDLQPVRPFGPLSLFGWEPGWLVTYILTTLLFTFPLRKLFDVH